VAESLSTPIFAFILIAFLIDLMIFHLTHAGRVITLLSLGISSLRSLVRFRLTDREKIAEQNKLLKERQKMLDEAKKSGDMEAAQKHQADILEASLDRMKHSLKPMAATTIPYIIVFGWIKSAFAESGTVAEIMGYSMGWFGWYIISSMAAGMLLQKAYVRMKRGSSAGVEDDRV